MVFCSLFFFRLCTFSNNRRGPNPLCCPDVHPFFVKISKHVSRFSLVSGHVDTGTKSRTHTAMGTNKKLMFGF